LAAFVGRSPYNFRAAQVKENMKTEIDAIILTRDEELNLSRCLQSVKSLGAKTWVVDSGSMDRTSEVAKAGGAEFVLHGEYVNQAQQFNWALDNLPLKGEWVLRLDADERLMPELADEIRTKLDSVPYDVSGFYLKRRVYFMGRWMRHGGHYPIWLLRLFRRGKGRSEAREMDEHIVLLEGRADRLKNDFADDNQKSLSEWTRKHDDYSTREVRARLKESGVRIGGRGLVGPAGRKRWVKQKFFLHLPLFFRSFAYFIYRYVFRLGFLDGKEGLIYHVLQGFWHQFLTDAKEYEMRKRANHEERER
jgi:glycosyltransferase involved in cell wall biosynthesis